MQDPVWMHPMKESLFLIKVPDGLLRLMKMTSCTGPTLSLRSVALNNLLLSLRSHILQCSWGLAALCYAESSDGLLPKREAAEGWKQQKVGLSGWRPQSTDNKFNLPIRERSVRTRSALSLAKPRDT